jgi:hypothetical protein
MGKKEGKKQVKVKKKEEKAGKGIGTEKRKFIFSICTFTFACTYSLYV